MSIVGINIAATEECFTSESSSWSGFVAIPMCTGIGYLSIFNKFNAGDTCAEIYFPTYKK